VNSTNSYLKDLVQKKDELEGQVVFAHKQDNGRGEGGNIWISHAGKNATFSIFLKPKFILLNRQFDLNMMVSICLCDYLAELGIRSLVKWPNDIFVENQKIAGILIENSLKSGKIEDSIIGIGLNINQVHFPEMSNNPTSVKLIKGLDLDPIAIAIELVNRIQKAYHQQAFQRSRHIRDRYHELLYKIQSEEKFENLNGEVFEGKIVGVEPSGRLVIQNKQGKTLSFGYKEIKFFKKEI